MHYHLTSGLRGGYIPNRVEYYSRKSDAVRVARDLVAEYRDSGDKVRGSVYPNADGDLVGYWIARESESMPGTFWDYISVRRCNEQCDPEEEWD